MAEGMRILIVDDEPFNVDLLEQELEDLDYETLSAYSGKEALEVASEARPDLILLDIMMPGMSGFEVLEVLKADELLCEIPVVIISAMSDVDSVAKGIALGAEDYLPKPFEPALLQARVSTCLDKKRLRDRELAYLQQVQTLTEAAIAVENKTFVSEQLSELVCREDALGQLARVFQRMANEVHIREQRLLRQIEELRVDRQERERAAGETVSVYLPIDRRLSLVGEEPLPQRSEGVALFADISGFTPLTASLARHLERQRGAEALMRQLNRLYEALIQEVHLRAGSVLSFSGDAITCWFAQEPGFEAPSAASRALACAFAMQSVLNTFGELTIEEGLSHPLAIKVALSQGEALRLLVGDSSLGVLEVLAGAVLDNLAIGAGLVCAGEILAAEALVEPKQMSVTAWRTDPTLGARFASLSGFGREVPLSPWPKEGLSELSEESLRPWLLAPVYAFVREGKSEFLGELRECTALFLKFEGIVFDDEEAAAKLDSFIQWVQEILARHHAYILQLSIEDKGCYLYSAFGAPHTQANDAVQAVEAAWMLEQAPAHFSFLTGVSIGLARGLMRAGPYGSSARRTYGVVGEQTNISARLMQAAGQGILCEASVVEAAQGEVSFVPLAPLHVKGKEAALDVFQPVHPPQDAVLNERLDGLAPTPQLILKVASLLGARVSLPLLRAIYPIQEEKESLGAHLQMLCEERFLAPGADGIEQEVVFLGARLRTLAYERMLFAQRRSLHRAAARWFEDQGTTHKEWADIAYHWEHAEDPLKASAAFEKAGQQARERGDHAKAKACFDKALALEAQGAVLSASYTESEKG